MTNARVGTWELGVEGRENAAHDPLLAAHRIHHCQPTALTAAPEREPSRDLGQDQKLLPKFAQDVDEQGYAGVRAGVAERVDKELALLGKETQSDRRGKFEEVHRPWRRKVFGP